MIRILIICILSVPIIGEEIADPIENLNRDIFIFNEKLDEKILKPAAVTYRKITPQFARNGVTNFFNNLEEIDTSINQVLQGEIKYALNDATRFVVNSTIGLFGLIDVASKMGLERHEEDFGQTLGVWGVDAGPYIMLPFFVVLIRSLSANGMSKLIHPTTRFNWVINREIYLLLGTV